MLSPEGVLGAAGVGEACKAETAAGTRLGAKSKVARSL